jgi:mono/diheme cytochrome c family protein
MKSQILFLFLILFVSLSFTNKYDKKLPKESLFFDGKETYEIYCVACHQNDGNGQPGTNPPLIGSDWVKGDKNRLIKTVMMGLTEPIEVNGIKYNNAMPAHDYLEDADLANVLTYVRKNFGQMTDSVTVAEVKIVREKLK